MPDIDFEDLIQRYRNGQCTLQEIAEVESWYIFMTAHSRPLKVYTNWKLLEKRILSNIYANAEIVADIKEYTDKCRN